MIDNKPVGEYQPGDFKLMSVGEYDVLRIEQSGLILIGRQGVLSEDKAISVMIQNEHIIGVRIGEPLYVVTQLQSKGMFLEMLLHTPEDGIVLPGEKRPRPV